MNWYCFRKPHELYALPCPAVNPEINPWLPQTLENDMLLMSMDELYSQNGSPLPKLVEVGDSEGRHSWKEPHVLRDLDFLGLSAFLIKHLLNMRKPCYSSLPQITGLLYICKDCQLLFLFLEIWQNRDLGERKTDTVWRNPPPLTKKPRAVPWVCLSLFKPPFSVSVYNPS